MTNNYNISIIIPGIRPQNWSKVADSIDASIGEYSYEVIFVGPYPLPVNLETDRGVKYVKDFGTPMRCSNIGGLLATGELITWGSDDGLYTENSLKKTLDTFYNLEKNNKNIITCKYFEGEGYSGETDTKSFLVKNDNYKINKAYPGATNVPNNWWILNVGIMYRSYFEELGGWDCNFQSCPLGHADMAIRAQADGAKVYLSSLPMLNCDHMPGTSGDHAPIHHAQLGPDKEYYLKKYHNIDLEELTVNIDINNWKQAAPVWKERFTDID